MTVALRADEGQGADPGCLTGETPLRTLAWRRRFGAQPSGWTTSWGRHSSGARSTRRRQSCHPQFSRTRRGSPPARSSRLRRPSSWRSTAGLDQSPNIGTARPSCHPARSGRSPPRSRNLARRPRKGQRKRNVVPALTPATPAVKPIAERFLSGRATRIELAAGGRFPFGRIGCTAGRPPFPAQVGAEADVYSLLPAGMSGAWSSLGC